MATIRKPVLKVLEAIYGFIDSQDGAPSEMQLGLGITPVHDVSRMAALAAADFAQDRRAGGYWVASEVQAFVASGSLNTSLNLVSPPVASEGYTLDEGTQWAWVIDVWLSATELADFNSARVLLAATGNDFFVGPSDIAPSSQPRLLYNATAVAPTNTNVGLNAAVGVQLPTLVLSPQDGLLFQGNANGAGTVTITYNVLLWVGLRNTFPPGMH